jgi:hypothetical protein
MVEIPAEHNLCMNLDSYTILSCLISWDWNEDSLFIDNIFSSQLLLYFDHFKNVPERFQVNISYCYTLIIFDKFPKMPIFKPIILANCIS